MWRSCGKSLTIRLVKTDPGVDSNTTGEDEYSQAARVKLLSTRSPIPFFPDKQWNPKHQLPLKRLRDLIITLHSIGLSV